MSESRKLSELIERISEETDKPKSTLYDWKNSEKNKKLFEVLIEYIDLKEKDENYHQLDDKEFLKKEINRAIDRLPKSKAKKFYHIIMAELSDFE